MRIQNTELSAGSGPKPPPEQLWTRGHALLKVHPQAVGQAVDIVEVGRHLGGVVDGSIGPAQSAQMFDVLLGHRCRGLGELDRVVQQPAGGFVEVRLAVIRLDRFDQLIVLDLRPEVFSMGDNSVMALIHPRDDGGDHLPLSPAQRRVAEHGFLV